MLQLASPSLCLLRAPGPWPTLKPKPCGIFYNCHIKTLSLELYYSTKCSFSSGGTLINFSRSFTLSLTWYSLPFTYFSSIHVTATSVTELNLWPGMRRAAGGVHAATAWKGAHGNGWRKCGAEGGLCGELKVAGSGRWWLVPSPWHGNKLSLAPNAKMFLVHK